MKKVYLFGLCSSLFLTSFLHAQKKADSFVKGHGVPNIGNSVRTSNVQYRTTADCDTVNIPFPEGWNLDFYTVTNGGGYVTGTNKYADKEKAAYFDVSPTDNLYLTKAYIYFPIANTNTPANLTKIVPINVYEGNMADGPTNLITTVNKTLAELKADVDAAKFTEVVFGTGVTLPASKEFFISVDLSNLAWSTTAAGVKDSLLIVSTTDGDVYDDNNGMFYEKWDDDTWYQGVDGDAWGLDLSLAIFPILGASRDCGASLPITLSSFTGERQGSKNALKWITQSEQNNKGFELERSADGTNFTSLGFTNSKAAGGNSSSSLTYLFDDVKPFKGSSYYRLKQVDKDGKFKLSSVVMIKGLKAIKLGLGSLYPNPTKAMLNLVITAPANDKINLLVTDLAGKLVMQQSAQMISGDNNLQLNVAKLPAGSYMIKAICANGCETAVSKFVKQ